MMQVPDFSNFKIIKTFNFPNLPKMIELEPMFGNDLTGHELNPCQNQTSNIMFFLLPPNPNFKLWKKTWNQNVKIFRFGASLKLLTTSTTPYYIHVYCMFLILFGLEKWLFIDFTPKFWHFNVQGCCQTNGEVSKWKIPHIAVCGI